MILLVWCLGVQQKARVVKPLLLVSGVWLRIIPGRDVSARHDPQEGRQGHRHFNVVENRCVAGGRVVQRHVLHLGAINSSQQCAWRRSIEVSQDGANAPRTVALFTEGRVAGLVPDASIVTVKLSALRLRRRRQLVACCLALTLWQTLDLDVFFVQRLPP